MTSTIAANTATTSATSPAPAAATTSSSGANTKISSDFETFLTMLTAQLQNQDPLNPIEGADYAVQLATFSEVEQAVQTNDLLKELSAQMGLMGFSQLSGWVGMEARSESPTYFDGSSPVTLSSEFATAADNATLVVRDSSGAVVQTLTMEPVDGPFEWAGVDDDGNVLDAGTYSFEIENYYGTEYLSTSSVETYSRIVEARSDSGDVVLVLEGGTELDSDAVTALREPS